MAMILALRFPENAPAGILIVRLTARASRQLAGRVLIPRYGLCRHPEWAQAGCLLDPFTHHRCQVDWRERDCLTLDNTDSTKHCNSAEQCPCAEIKHCYSLCLTAPISGPL